jgi:transcriptional regulator with XRE-family HTH domain
MSIAEINPILNRLLLLQLGDRLKRLRKTQGISVVEMAKAAKLSRNTLRSIEVGSSSTSIGSYLRVMSVLGVSGGLAILVGDAMQSPASDSAHVRSRHSLPLVQVNFLPNNARHQLQDLQSLVLHEEAVRMVKTNPLLLQRAENTVEHWLTRGNNRSVTLWREWQLILKAGSWRKVLSSTSHAQQLRQSSPLVTILPEEVRKDILRQVSGLKKGMLLSNASASLINRTSNF